MIVLPSWVNEYSTVMAFDCVTCLAIKPRGFEIAESSGQHKMSLPRWQTPHVLDLAKSCKHLFVFLGNTVPFSHAAKLHHIPMRAMHYGNWIRGVRPAPMFAEVMQLFGRRSCRANVFSGHGIGDTYLSGGLWSISFNTARASFPFLLVEEASLRIEQGA
jgi:hypothetical protein